jgi:hypothetical protein
VQPNRILSDAPQEALVQLPEPDAPLSISTTPADKIAQTIAFAALYAAPALLCLHGPLLGDPDIWWHLSTGNWIMQHHAVPHVDIFSSAVGGHPWQAYSWLFELLVAWLYQHLGFVGIFAYTAAMVLAITAALHRLVRRLQPDFAVGVLLTFVAVYSLGRLYTPRPWLFTILLFILEVDILMHVRKTGQTRRLAWLPFIFALWANLHIQFINGLLVLFLALAESVAARWQQGGSPKRRTAALAGTLIASLLATLANPYGWHIYRIAYDLASQAGVLDKVIELQAISFRDPQDFLILILALAATAVLARKRQLQPFEVGLLAFAAYTSFRSQRDIWIMAVAAAAILAGGITTGEQNTRRVPGFIAPIAVVLACLALLFDFRVMHRDNAALATQQARDLPVKAVQFIQQKGYRGPLYNDYGWGGYLIWSLHMPVSIDGRAALYGDQRIDRSVQTWSGQPDWASDPQLSAAGIVIGPVKSPLTQLLRLDPRFELAYEDKMAAVFVPRK